MSPQNFPQGYLAIVLHAHLPFVRHPEHPSFLEEDWLFEAVTETYLPLLDVFEKLAEERVGFRLTMSITPTLCEMLTDDLLVERCAARLDLMLKLCESELVRTSDMPELNKTANMYYNNFKKASCLFNEKYNRDIISAFRSLQDRGFIEIITSAATHGFLPLFSTKTCVRAQLKAAVKNYEKHFGRSPSGVWIPECGYEKGLESELAAVGLKYFFLDSHGVLYSKPRPKYSVFAPVITRENVAVFGRDIESSRQVWSSETGYPGNGLYREFYRDLGYDAEFEYIKPYLHGDNSRKNLGIKYHRITGKHTPLEQKEYYDPDAAAVQAAEDVGNFLFNRGCQVKYLSENLDIPPVIVAPYDAELFGHWWYEGPQFIDILLRRILFDQQGLRLVTPSEYLSSHSTLQLVEPAPSSWGDKGYYEVWLNGSNDWIYRHLHKAENVMIKLAEIEAGNDLTERALNQAARELMLAQASDWAFIMTTGTMVDYAVKRTNDHVGRFFDLAHMVENNSIEDAVLTSIEGQDNIFPEINYRIYRD
ncbi:MAG: glycoside hydrolase family 57 protein [Planctomycetota bacterium]|jgi:1,4-alpha-glucan branching enzyme